MADHNGCAFKLASRGDTRRLSRSYQVIPDKNDPNDARAVAVACVAGK